MTLQPLAVAPVMGLIAATPEAGVALVNGTPNLLTWQVPNDGQLHRIVVISNAHVTVATTGGNVVLNYTLPDGLGASSTMLAGTQGTGNQNGNLQTKFVQPGSVVTVAQSSAVTAGASTAWAEIWGS